MTLIDLPVRHRPPPASAAEITLSIATSFETSGISRQQWDEFILDAGGDIYSSYDWCRIWWKHYGGGRNLRLFVFRERDELVGIAPMFWERIWVGPARIKIAKPVGADFAMDVFGLPVFPRFLDTACKQIVSHLIARERCDAVWFGFVPSDHPSLIALRQAVEEMDDAVVARDAHAGVLAVFDIPTSFENYMNGLGKAARQNARRQLRLLKEASCVKQIAVRNPIDPSSEFDAFKQLHTTQWEAEGLPGHFNDWPMSDAFNRDLVTRFSSLGRLRLMNLHSDEEIIATQYAFTFGASGYWRLAGRSMDQNFCRYGLGVLGLVQLLEQMYSEGIRRVEGGYGRYPYKLKYGAKELGVTSLLVKSTRRLSSVRIFLFVGLSQIINLLYYRIWRLRISPRLPLRSSPLWRIWIRLRI